MFGQKVYPSAFCAQYTFVQKRVCRTSYNRSKMTCDPVAILMTNAIRKKHYLVLFVMQIVFGYHENISLPDGHAVCQKQK